MSIDSEANKDLALNDEDAESVVGGTKKKAAKPAHTQVTHHAAASGHSLPPINVQGAPSTDATSTDDMSGDTNPDDC